MNALISQSLILQNKLELPDAALVIIQEALRNYCVETINVAKHLIEKREDPDTVRKFIEPHGLTYDGKSKKFK